MPAELGVGLVHFQALAPLVEERGAVDVVEVEPQVFWLPSDAGERYRDGGAPLRWLANLPVPKIAHGVGAPVGSARPPDVAAVDRFARDVSTLGAAWASEHLSFMRAEDATAGPFEAGFLLPPRQTRENAHRIAANIRAYARRMPVPFAFETGVNYLQPRSDELGDGEFVAAIAEEADCGILLDLHNAWTNARNGRQPLDAFLRALPLERVVEVHLAGGELHMGYWLDAHSGPAQPELMDALQRLLPELPSLRALIFELIADHVARIGLEPIRAQLAQMRRLWDARQAKRARGRRLSVVRYTQPDSTGQDRDALDWEDALAALVVGRKPAGPFASLADDFGILLLRDLVESQRAGAAVDSLKLTTRLVRLWRGSGTLLDELRAFWAAQPPSPFGADEGAALGAWWAERPLDLPHFSEVLAFERALLRIHRGGAGETVRFSCDPSALLGALAANQLPAELAKADVSLQIAADGTIAVALQREDGSAVVTA